MFLFDSKDIHVDVAQARIYFPEQQMQKKARQMELCKHLWGPFGRDRLVQSNVGPYVSAAFFGRFYGNL